MGIIISVATKIYKWAKQCKCNKIINVVQFVIGIVLVPIELTLVFGVLASARSTMQDEFFMNTLAEKVAMFFISHGFVIVFYFWNNSYIIFYTMGFMY